ncbi:MAG: hypothetical protein KatS3mg124_2197 [Porticoccaceae bacterium]|nr:MAG: hypothetical protein KatS3mg124_2197 [Porticoccaceae bacterium]
MKPLRPLLLALLLAGSPLCLGAAWLSVPLRVPDGLLAELLARELPGAGAPLPLSADPAGCNQLVVAEPRLRSEAPQGLGFEARLAARGGTPLGGRCLPLFRWEGTFSAVLAPWVGEDGGRLGFTVLSSALRPDDGASPLPGVLWDWVKAYVHPRLEALRLDLEPPRRAVRELLASLAPRDPALAEALGIGALCGGARAGRRPRGGARLRPARLAPAPRRRRRHPSAKRSSPPGRPPGRRGTPFSPG